MSELILEKNDYLPASWVKTTLEEVCLITLGQSPPSSTYNSSGDGLPFFQGKADFGELYPNTRIWCSSPQKIAEKNDLLLSVRAPVGSTNISKEQCCIGRGLASIRPVIDQMNVTFFIYFFRLIENELNSIGTGTTFKAISGKQIRELKIELPPLNEQKRIVEKIEMLFSLIDSNLEQLEHVQKQLIVYEKSLLLFAFNGILTHYWRLQNPETQGKETLEDSLEKRHQLWDEKEKSVKKPRKYLPPIRPSLSNLPQIPDMWTWASFEEISERVTVGFVGSMRNEYLETGIPFLRSQNVRKNRYDEKGLKFISQEFHEKISKSKLSPNDIVAVRSGDVGVSCVIPDTLTNSNCSDLLIVKNPLGINPYFGSFYLNSIRESRVRQQQVGIALTHFNTKSLAKLAIPVPNIEEQNLIVMIVSSSYSFMDNAQMILDQTVHKLLGLKKSILKLSFEGKLVPQDPNDEPAEILLQKIKQEKQLIQKQKASRRKKNVK